jgi:hypothetical protein
MPADPALFDLSPADASTVDPTAKQTPAQALRARQAARIAVGVHPLALDGSTIRLHLDARTEGGPTCGTCLYRRKLGGHAKDYPKCLYGYTETPIPEAQQRRYGPKLTITMPRVTRGAATDCLAAWPACTDWAPADTTPPPAPPERPAARTDDPWES